MNSATPGSLATDALTLQLRRLRFDAATEADFRASYERRSIPARLTGIVLAILLIGTTPLYDERLLAAPAAFLRIERLLDFGVEIPALLLALIATAVPRFRGASAQVSMFAAVTVGLAVMVQRVMGLRYDFYLPHDLAVMPLSGVLILGRLRLAPLLPWVVIGLVAITWAQVFVIASPVAFYDSITEWMQVLLAFVAAYLIERSERESWYRGQLLEFRATHDPLTGLANRRRFDEELARLVSVAQQHRRSLALMIFDIDHFKVYNDTYGHPAGDECLRRIGQFLSGLPRGPQDFSARIGGEEFAAIWYDLPEPEAVRLAEHLRDGIEALGIPTIGDSPVVTASGGLAILRPPRPDQPGASITTRLLMAADSALYDAKRAGRRRLVLARVAGHDTAF